MIAYWNSLLSPRKQYSNNYDGFEVPFDSIQGVIFGGVYYVLARDKSINPELLNSLEFFVTKYTDAFIYFK